MKLSEIKKILSTAEAVNFELENGTKVPENFHVTEIGIVTKHFIDCGGTIRNEKVAIFQLWNANDIDHRLTPHKLAGIIELSEKLLAIEDFEIEIEYQTDTIGKYNLAFNGKNFILISTKTNCLAKDNCGVPSEMAETNSQKACCTPTGGCC